MRRLSKNHSTHELHHWLAWLAGALGLLFSAAAGAAGDELATADVVVVVDTSTSMRDEGMDPRRTSLLVTKLLADIVPGDLAVIRLLDLAADADVLPSHRTGRTGPCSEDPSSRCEVVEPAADWTADARRRKLGALERPVRGDAEYKRRLDAHLQQRINNSPFDLAFRAAQGIFDDHAGQPAPRTVIWLSDGRSDNEAQVCQAIAELVAGGAVVEAIVFGRGETRLAREAGIEVEQVGSPAQIMRAFAGAFRRVVRAPYEIDHLVSEASGFEIKPHVDEAWIVVYGDDTLEDAALEGPASRDETRFAADRLAGAGAYRVAYLRRPRPGRWTVRARGGGPGTAYAVVQRSALHPVLLAPREAVAGIPVTLVAGVAAGLGGELLTDPEVLADAALTASFQGNTYELTADRNAGDGRYAAEVVVRGSGSVEVALRLLSALVDRTSTGTVAVAGMFRSIGDTPQVDLGTLKAGNLSCRPLEWVVEREGEVPLELRGLRELPAGHRLEIRLPAGKLEPGGGALPSVPEDRPEVCLRTGPRASGSTAAGEPWLELRLAGSEDLEHAVAIALRWTVESLSFRELWGRWILAACALLLAAFIAGGILWPQRFQRSLAVAFAPDLEELDEQSPQPVVPWKGVGIGFYRHARAFLHPDFRLSGRSQGALAGLHAEKGATRLRAGKGGTLYRETLDGDWDVVVREGRRVRPGDVYRLGEQGPYLRIALQQGGRR